MATPNATAVKFGHPASLIREYRPVFVANQSDEVTTRFHSKYPDMKTYNNMYTNGFLMYVGAQTATGKHDGVLSWDAAIMHQAASSELMGMHYAAVFPEDSDVSSDDSDDDD